MTQQSTDDFFFQHNNKTEAILSINDDILFEC